MTMSVIKMLEQFEVAPNGVDDDAKYDDHVDCSGRAPSTQVLSEIDLMYADLTSRKSEYRIKHQRRNSPKARTHRERRRRPAQQVEA